uniref:Uncharacterized protein n=1 Tax=Meloidogyne javanica TaxID=6303 RepID=A0A915M0E6_MELJA
MDSPFKTYICAGFCCHAKKHANFEEVRLNRVISGYWGNFKDKRHAFDVRRGYLIKFMSKSKKIVKELESTKYLNRWSYFAKVLEERVNSVIDRLDVRGGKHRG